MAGKRKVSAAAETVPYDPVPGVEPVPTFPELARRGLARTVAANVYRATPEGQALVYEIMARNAARARAHETARAAWAELERG